MWHATCNKSLLNELCLLFDMDFIGKMHFYFCAFLIYVLVIAYGYCSSDYNNLGLYKILNTLKNDINSKSFQLYPKLKVYFVSDDKSLQTLEQKLILDGLKRALRSTAASEMDFEKDRVDTSKTGRLLKYQHRKKIEELIEFMRERYSSTNYFYNEMKRIQSQYTIKDKMREMIEYCESPQNVKVKEKILSLFDMLKTKHDEELNLWNQPTHDLVINVIKDPYNDGV